MATGDVVFLSSSQKPVNFETCDFILILSSGTAGVWVINLVSNWPERRGSLQEICIIDQILNPPPCSVFVPALQEFGGEASLQEFCVINLISNWPA